MRRALCLAAGAAALFVTACSSGSGSSTFSPSPADSAVEGGGNVQIAPILPTPSAGAGGSAGSGSGSSAGGSSAPSSGASTQDPLVVATRLTSPTGLALLPDGTALVGERTTGRIVRVQPVAGRPVPTVRTLPGLSAVGGGGLLDLAVSPDYAQDNLIYAYVTTPTDNRVVDFTLTGPVTPVLTGIPRGPSDNAGRITFGADGDLYVATGDAGRSADADKPSSLAGKILRVSDIGKPAAGNPFAGSAVFATGFRTVAGLCASPSSPNVYEVETHAAGQPGEVNVVTRGGYYGWPAASASAKDALGALPTKTGNPGGCAVLDGRLWVTSLDGRTLLSTTLRDSATPTLSTYVPVLTGTYGRLLTVVPAADGALWLTTANKDGGTPTAADDRVIRYPPSQVGGVTGQIK